MRLDALTDGHEVAACGPVLEMDARIGVRAPRGLDEQLVDVLELLDDAREYFPLAVAIHRIGGYGQTKKAEQQGHTARIRVEGHHGEKYFLKDALAIQIAKAKTPANGRMIRLGWMLIGKDR